MSLPRQVQEQLKELEKIEAQLAAGQAPVNEPKAPETTVNTQQAQPENTDPAPAPEPAPEVKAEKPVDPPVADEKWEQKYKTLKGMYDAEVPRLHAQVKDLTARLDNLQRAAETKPEPKVAAAHEKLVTDADVQAFGEDLIEVQRKVAREVDPAATTDHRAVAAAASDDRWSDAARRRSRYDLEPSPKEHAA